MSESFPQPEQPERPERHEQAEQPEQPEQSPKAPKSPRKGLGAALPRGRGARWAVAAGAAAVIVGGGAAAVAVAGHHHDGRADKVRHFARPEVPGHPGAHKIAPQGGPQGGPKAVREGAQARGGFARKAPAPAPLPSLPIGQAAEKAAGAVEGGKVQALRAVAQQGGGSAWLAVVLGPDGVRHAVTVSGSDGTITSNVPLNHR
ncbi:hypothetical protein [Streptomyces sp. NBC_00091]|uniref:hypothetical protein n=1 Tax=Streptomyces sp. NBC_00091 TaxID=2975648 RepID=UPI002250029F|nr:hypothetical protein [Streptomyces sp. NBC_00091]MCX5380803.1 hypothetical protein [Streptomyces sp. NBC_00091]